MTLIERLRVLSNSGLTQDDLDTVMAAIRRIQQLEQGARDSRNDARDAATESRWMARNEDDGVPYGTY